MARQPAPPRNNLGTRNKSGFVTAEIGEHERKYPLVLLQTLGNHAASKEIVIVILMGVTGCGKTKVGEILARDCGWDFHDADDFHPAENVAKMKRGEPLDDADRWPWLARLNTFLLDSEQQGKSLVLACSALKQAYRERLAQGCAAVRFVFLDGDIELIRARLATRRGHYMNPKLLDSQFTILERPEDALRLDIAGSPPELVTSIRKAFAL